MLITYSTPRTAVPVVSVSEMFNKGLFTFGFTVKSHIFCDPLYETRRPSSFPELVKLSRGISNPENDYFSSIPVDSLPAGVKEHLGDTLTMLWSKATSKLVVKAVGIYSDACHMQGAYALIPLDSMPQQPSWKDQFLLLTKRVKLHGPVIPYRKYEIKDHLLLDFEDSIRAIVSQTHEKEIKTSLDDLTVEYYGVMRNTLPDTLFMTVHGHWYGATEWCWHTVYVAVRSDSGWKYSEVLKLNKGNRRFQIDSAFDLNGDGIMEMLVMESASSAVYSIVNGQLVPVAMSGYRGC
ncbi:MAG: hypothetical protein ACE5K8_03090 [Candidatus Zixiibacteriota bacterium]